MLKHLIRDLLSNLTFSTFFSKERKLQDSVTGWVCTVLYNNQLYNIVG